MTNRIGGDFNQDAVEAFRAAYAAQMSTPDQQEQDTYMGLPSNVVTNTSPWIEHTGLWKYPSGKGPDQDLKTAFDPNQYLSSEISEDDEDAESLSEEEVENLLNEITGSSDEDEE